MNFQKILQDINNMIADKVIKKILIRSNLGVHMKKRKGECLCLS